MRTREEMERRVDAHEQLVLAAHTLAEVYAVLTRLPARHRLRSADAIAVIEANWADTEVVHLTGKETWGALREAHRLAKIGGQMYDVLIAVSALKAQAATIVTWNGRHYAAFAPRIGILAPR